MFELVTWPRSPWTIFNELESLQANINRSIHEARIGRRGSVYPRMNVWSAREGIIVDAELPGVDPKDVDISVLGDELTVRGKVNVGEEQAGEVYYRRERPAGEFERTIKMPFRADSAGVKANYKNGVLRLTVPRCKEEMARKITVEAA